ncbi:hypothetical protein AAMO2058_000240500 [Amorphochlora amoebiformis]
MRNFLILAFCFRLGAASSLLPKGPSRSQLRPTNRARQPMEKPKCLAIGAAAFGAGLLSSFAIKRLFKYKPPKVWKFTPQGGKFGHLNKPTAGPQQEMKLPKGEHDLQLYSLATPNGVKANIMLEELCDKYGIEYDAYTINIGEGDQFGSGFVGVNPNSKIPALVDYSDEKKPIRVFESGSILVYLADKFDEDGAFLPKDPAKRTEVLNWVFWQVGSAPYLGGGFGHFYNYAPIKIKYAIDRFSMETKRQMDVLERALAGKDGSPGGPYLCGKQYTIADMMIWPWYGVLAQGKLYGDAKNFLELEKYPNVQAWAKLISAREAVMRGRKVTRVWGEDWEQMKERHSKADFDKLPSKP